MDIQRCRNAEEFLKALDPLGKKWHGCYFRGQSNAAWELYPTIWRPHGKGGDYAQNLFENFTIKSLQTNCVENTSSFIIREKGYSKESYFLSKKINQTTIKNIKKWSLFIRFENYLLSHFYSMVNHAGLKISEEQLMHCKDFYPDWWLNDCTIFEEQNLNLYKMILWYGEHELIQDHISYLQTESIIKFDSSLPQHYGLPTRSLDWTSRSLKAAFFAANSCRNLEIAKKNKKSIDIAVYVIKIKEPPKNFDPNKKWPYFVYIKDRHSQYTNAFLHAQDGLFTNILGDFYYWEKGEWPSIDKIDQEFPGKFFELKKFVLSAKYANELLQILSCANISLSTMMPHYSYVAKEIIESHL